jgi:O-antigen/teichoic acid export membrane protein
MIINWKKIMTPYDAFAKNSMALFFGTLLVSFFNYLFHLIIGRQVSVEIYGEAESLISLINIISVPAATLTMVATKYTVAHKVDENQGESYVIWSYLHGKIWKYGGPFFVLMALATPWISTFLNIQNNTALFLIWSMMLLSFFSAVNSGILRGWQKFGAISLSNVYGTSMKLLGGIVFVWAGWSLNGIIGSFVLGVIVSYVATIWSLKFIFHRKEIQRKKEITNETDFSALRHYIVPVFVGNLAITILGNVDMVLAKRNLDAIAAGQYGALFVVSKVIFFATGVIASVLFSMSAENKHKGQSSRQILAVAVGLIVGASAIATGIYFLYPTFILSLLFGEKYQGVAAYLGWFAIAATLFSLSNVLFQFLLSVHKTKIAYVILAVAGGLTGAIFFYGKSIDSILIMVIVSQIITIASSFIFLMSKKIIRKNI